MAPDEAFYLFVERGHWRHNSGLAGGCERDRDLQRHDLCFPVQEERGGLALVNGIVYVSYSGYVGDCGNYHGWVVGVDINNPVTVGGWATTAIGGGIWGHGGVASDGTNMFVVTGNTFNTGGNWMGGEAIIRLQAGPIFNGPPSNANYWAPTNWFYVSTIVIPT